MIGSITTALSKYCNASVIGARGGVYTTSVFDRVDHVNTAEWASVVNRDHQFLCLDYLGALEKAHNQGLELRYTIFKEGQTVIGAAAFQITHFTTSDDAYTNPLLKVLSHIASLLRGKHVHNILICGNAIATGEHGFAFHKQRSIKEVAACIAGAMKEIAEKEKAKGKRICAMVVKDFYPDTANIAEELTSARFKKFQVDHNMMMPILGEWQTFEDYLQAMTTKFRTKAKAALGRSAALEIKEVNAQEILPHLDVMDTLYTNVYSKADFRLGKLDVKTLANLLEALPQNFTVMTYTYENKIVGFISAMCCGNILEAHIVGIDYEVNKELAVYQRMLYDFVALAIRKRCVRIVFGRTAAEIKSTIGAFPVDLTCCVMHQRRISNALLSLILQYVKPSVYPQRQPYKNEILAKLNEQSLY